MPVVIYSFTLLAAITTLVLSIYSLRAPDWIRFDTPPSSPFQYSSTYGLRSKCDRSNLTPEFICRPFPDRAKDCRSASDSSFNPTSSAQNQTLLLSHLSPLVDRVPVGSGLVDLDSSDLTASQDGFGFCEKWISAGFFSELSTVIGVISIVCVSIVLMGNHHRQRTGWKICAGLVGVHAIFQIISWVLILRVFNSDNRFYLGSRLHTGFYISVCSSVLDLVVLSGLISAALTGLVGEDDDDDNDSYQPIP